MNIYTELQKLAKSIKYQNLLSIAKEMNAIRLFRNKYDFSSIQMIFLNYLYNFEMINREIITEKISKHVLDSEIMWNAYLMWRQQNKPKIDKPQDKSSQKTIKLVTGTKINFPQDKK